ncbi:unnamed protein product [Schistosoma haematobium]|nr:unnamed protein product [Schistosoma haematobium]
MDNFSGLLVALNNIVEDMVCIPCIVIPVMLWILHRLLYPVMYYFFPKLKPIPEPTVDESEQLDDITKDDVTDTYQPSSPSKSKSD